MVEKEKNNILSPLWKENQIIKPCEKCGGDIRLRHGIVCDPFCGSGTTLIVAKKLGRNFIGIELSEEYVKIAEARIEAAKPPQPKLIP
ncbi:MAG: site-specific DNA-methyltransferase [Actinobacteria bacterium]|nr:site-specific DNA-methyltransferase [Actinomycetota bacterium]